MEAIKEIYESLDFLDSHIFSNSASGRVIALLRKRLNRLTEAEEKEIISCFNLEMFVKSIPFIVHSLNFFKNNTTNLPVKFKQDLVLKYLLNYEQVISSTEDIFLKNKNEEVFTIEYEKLLNQSLY